LGGGVTGKLPFSSPPVQVTGYCGVDLGHLAEATLVRDPVYSYLSLFTLCLRGWELCSPLRSPFALTLKSFAFFFSCKLYYAFKKMLGQAP
jgi:hypothetical protein